MVPVPIQFPVNVLVLASNTPVTCPQHTSPEPPGEGEGETEAEGEIEALGLIEADGLTEGLTLPLGETDGLTLPEGLTDGLTEPDGLTLALGETDGEGDTDALAPAAAPIASTNVKQAAPLTAE